MAWLVVMKEAFEIAENTMSKFSKIIFFAAALMVAAACGRMAKIDASIDGVSSSDILVKVLKSKALEVVDTVAADEAGRLSYKMEIDKGQVEFVYLYRGSKRLASMLLKQGDKVVIEADTLGNFSVSGSDESAKLAQVENEYISFLKRLHELNAQVDAASSPDEVLAARQAMGQEYLAYYRGRVKYIMANSRSMSVIPVLYQTMGENLPVFGQTTDAIHFRNAADSLELEYPDSRHVKALRQEAERRLGFMSMENLVNNAQQIGYPDIELPDLNGQKRKLSDVDSKVVMIHFWSAADAQQKMFNLDVLKPLYKEYHKKGFEIYQVSLDVDKGLWAGVVKQQSPEWVSVCDSRGAASPYAAVYNLPALPAFFIISDGALVDGSVVDEASLRKLLNKLL